MSHGLSHQWMASVLAAAAFACTGAANESRDADASAPTSDSSARLADATVDAGADTSADATLDSAKVDAADSSIGPRPDAGGSLGPHGVYVPTFDKSLSSMLFHGDLALPYVDGIFLSRPWNAIETSEGNYDWSSLNADIMTAAAAGKTVTLAISAGDNAPAYVCQSAADGGAGAQCLTLVVHPPQDTSCLNEVIPLPWDPVLQARFGKLVTSMGQDILGNPTLAAAVVDVKVTGFNERDEETILPASHGGTVACTTGAACVNMQCAESDAIGAFEAAGYTDSTATTAYLAFAHMFRAAFPGLPIGSMVSSSLPSPGADSLPLLMVQDFVNDTTLRPITVQDNGLAGASGVDPGTMYARDAGVAVGFQMLAYVAGNPTCLMGRGAAPDGGNAPCDEALLKEAINLGLSGGAQWLEIYTQDVTAYPDASTYAHDQL